MSITRASTPSPSAARCDVESSCNMASLDFDRIHLPSASLLVDASWLADVTLTFTFFALWTGRRAIRYLAGAQAALLCTMITRTPDSTSSRAELAAAICLDSRSTLESGVAFAPILRIPFPIILLAFVLLKAFLAARFVHSGTKDDGPELACHLMLTSVTLHLAVGSLLILSPALPSLPDGWWAAAEAYTVRAVEKTLPWCLFGGGLAMLGTAAWRGVRSRGRRVGPISLVEIK